MLKKDLTSHSSTVVENSPYKLKVYCSNPASVAGTRRKRMLKKDFASCSSTVVDHLPYHPNGQGSKPAIAAGTKRQNAEKRFCQLQQHNGRTLTLSPKSLGFKSSNTATGTRRQKMLRTDLTNSRSTVVEHSPYHPNAQGSNLATAAGTSRQKMLKKSWLAAGAQWQKTRLINPKWKVQIWPLPLAPVDRKC